MVLAELSNSIFLKNPHWVFFVNAENNLGWCWQQQARPFVLKIRRLKTFFGDLFFDLPIFWVQKINR